MRLTRELALAARRLRGAPTFTIVATLTLALGTGALGAIAAVGKAVLVDPLPYPDPGRLIVLGGEMRRERTQAWPLGVSDLLDVAAMQPGMRGPAPVAGGRPLSVVVGENAAHVTGELVGHEYFAILGLRPAMGRFFTPEESATRTVTVAVISDQVWREQFGASPDVVGQSMLINERSAQVIGVMPASFGGMSGQARLWLPIASAAHLYQPGYLDVREFRWLSGVARLDDGTTLEAAATRLEAGLRTLERDFPKEYEGFHFTTTPMREAYFGDLEQPLWILLAAALLLLGIAATNLASLLLVRGLSRQRDVAIRVALGASHAGVLRGVASEVAIVVALGSAIGLWLAWLGLPLLLLRAGVALPSIITPTVSPLVMLATVATCAMACVVAAFLPVRHALRVDPATLIRSGAGVGRGRRRLQFALVAAETALAILLLAGTGLLIRGMQSLTSTDLGFSTADVTYMRVNLGSDRYAENERYATFVGELLDRVRAIPGVTQASVEGPGYPTSGTFGLHFTKEVLGAAPVDLLANRHHVSPGYFATLGIPLLSGRDFTTGDRGGAGNVAIVSRELAEELWPNEPAVGRTLTTSRGAPLTLTVIGVAETARHQGISDATFVAPNIYLPMLHLPPRTPPVVTLLVKAPGMEGTMPVALRAALREVDPLLPPVQLRTLREAVDDQTASARLLVTLMAVFGSVALVLAAVGVYGIVAYSVQQSTRELGIRLALGASDGRVMAHVLRNGLAPVVTGVLLGALAMPAAQRLVRSQLYGVGAFDPLALSGALLALTLAALVATVLPARRATRISVVRTIREE
jgi:predicted permease